MLTWIKLTGFKSFSDQQVRLAPTTLLIGANAAGKSNMLDALRFLQGLALGYSITDTLRGYWEGGRQIWPGIRGEIKEAAFFGTSSFSIETTWMIDGVALWYSITCATEPEVRVTAESLYLGDSEYLYDTHAPALKGQKGISGANINVALRTKSKGASVTTSTSANTSILSQLSGPNSIDTKRVRPDVLSYARAVRNAMVSGFFLDPRPQSMRDYVPKQARSLGVGGENLSAILARICENPNEREDVKDWLEELCSPELSAIDFVHTELGDVMLKIVERDGTTVSARSMSDGTLRFLCELTALKSVEPGSMLFIEELDNGLHPTRLFLLVDMLVRLARERQVQVIATTHSPLTLQQLPPDVLENTVVFGRTPEQHGTVMKRLGDLPDYHATIAEEGIDFLLTTGWIERSL